jgi:hypothetical protein
MACYGDSFTFLAFYILTLAIHLLLGLLNGISHSGFPTNNLYTFLFSPIRSTCPTHLILLNFRILIILGEEYKYAVFSTLPSLHLSSVQIVPSAPCSQKLSVYVPLLMSEAMFHTHIEPQAK